MLYVLSQILYISDVIAFAAAQLQKKKSVYILLFALADFLFALHYLCLESYSAVIFVGNETVLLIAIYLIQKFGNNKFTILASAITIIADIIACVLLWSTPLVLFALVATSLTCIGMCSKQIVFSKSLAVVSVICTTTYLYIIHSYVAAVVNTCMIFVSITGLVLSILDYNKHKKLNELNNEQTTQTPA